MKKVFPLGALMDAPILASNIHESKGKKEEPGPRRTLAWVPPPHPGVELVQSGAINQIAEGEWSYNFNPANPTTPGNLLIMAIATQPGALSVPPGWTEIDGPTAPGGEPNQVRLFYYASAPSLSSWTFGGEGNQYDMTFFEFSGLTYGGTLDQQSSASGSGLTGPIPASPSTTAPNEVAIALWTTPDFGQPTLPASPWIAGPIGMGYSLAAYQILSAEQTVAADCTMPSSPYGWVGMLATFS